ncbi:hypothetical protein CO058_00520 [candidate division WWE3 bacterium CG_4_9_14_0_2_um_filter_35_11]|uniref:Zinc finger DksA/TraR C4-type domain-containing protein n=1 Tax=candidate division WWE3 bacterium CG_4_9_14_0_2_um_filter_35_11 TaxID=1975077 RepID=A0A2M8EMQ6_UNCKA|nr:MAG: hypothetical protein COV25_01530 [candidate division WWE3 bacterium CG10_big_fil_rev_8_21_14_0_10_35_32]PJC24022.1 MAG: hypothetical protein CO058_00520 [candidate division WWE3 bacterium CG_4_9_14_0_2_um_filter_35_11]
MIDLGATSVAIIVFAFLIFIFAYWRDATAEGFSSDRIFDSVFMIGIGSFLGGKLLFRNLSLDYLKYQLLTSPLILEGILIGGAIAVYIAIKKNRWDGWEIGDMLAPALSIYQAILFFGFWIRKFDLSTLLLFVGFALLTVFIRYLKVNHKFGSSLRYFELKRLNRLTFTGGLFATYLTGSSLIAILFLLTHQNFSNWFWWFQFSFYFLILISSLFLIKRRLNIEGVKVNPVKQFSNLFIQKIKSTLMGRSKEIDKDVKDIEVNDPFNIEASDGFRNEDELGDEVQDNQQHGIDVAIKGELKEEKSEIKRSLSEIQKGTYGFCIKCGMAIDEKRLKAYPTAQYCMTCESKLAK